MTNWAQIFTDVLFVGIHQARLLVFENYQTSPVPLGPFVQTPKAFLCSCGLDGKQHVATDLRQSAEEQPCVLKRDKI